MLVVDNSSLMQRVLIDLLKADKQISVVGTARDGEDALSKISSLHPAFANLPSVKPVLQAACAPKRVSDKVISIAASTGGPHAITKILKTLPPNTPPILIVQHMPKGITKHFAEALNDSCKLAVKEAEEGDKVQAGLALVAPGGFHMVVTKERRVHLTMDPPVNFVRPSADVLMVSLSEIYGSNNVGVVLTGMGTDGAMGIRAIKEKGGVTIAQDEKTSVVFGMPHVAFQTGCVDTVVPLELISREILKACN